MIGSVRALLNEEEYELAGQLGLMGERRFQCDYRGSWLASGVASGTGEAVHVDDPLIVRTEDREPCVQVFAKNLMLRGRVGLYRPDRIFRNCHNNPLKQIQ